MQCVIKKYKHNITGTTVPSIRHIITVLKLHVDELSSARIWQYER